MTEEEQTNEAVIRAFDKWRASRRQEDFEGDPRDLIAHGFGFAFMAGMEWQKILEEPS
jgi:hypothetical protein